MVIEFPLNPPSYIINSHDGCCGARYLITLTMWLGKVKRAATLLTLIGGEDTGPFIVLKMLSGGNIEFFFNKGETARLVTFTTCNQF